MLDTHAGIPNALEGKGKNGHFMILYISGPIQQFRIPIGIRDFPSRSALINQPEPTDFYLWN